MKENLVKISDYLGQMQKMLLSPQANENGVAKEVVARFCACSKGNHGQAFHLEAKEEENLRWDNMLKVKDVKRTYSV